MIHRTIEEIHHKCHFWTMDRAGDCSRQKHIKNGANGLGFFPLQWIFAHQPSTAVEVQ